MEINSQYYAITSSTPLFLYGYTKKAKEIAHSLMERPYSVKGFVDVKAGELVSDGQLPIYQPDDVVKWTGEERPVIILCLQSILTQMDVADSLLKKGINQILLVSDTGGKDLKMACEMRRLYRRFFLHENLSGHLIPKYDAMSCRQGGIPIVERFEGSVCILCPVPLIYTSIVGETYAWLIKDIGIYQEKVQKYEDINIALDPLYSSFFEYMMTGGGDCGAYIEIYAKMSGRSMEDYFRDRVELFGLYEREYDANPSFFAETAASARWNPKGYFNLEDGHHRVAYLQKKGHIWIPLVISWQDYGKYENIEKEAELRGLLSRDGALAYKNAEIERRLMGKGTFDFQMKAMIAVCNFLFKEDGFLGYSYLDASESLGFFAVNISRMHAKNVAAMAKSKREKQLLKLTAEFTYQYKLQVVEQEEMRLEYDVIFTGEAYGEPTWKALQKRARRFFFFAFPKGDVTVQKKICHEECVKYQKITEYFDGARWMEYGVFLK